MKNTRILSVLFLMAGSSFLPADPLPEAVINRYEEILVKNPVPGPSFDKLYQHYLETDGTEALAKRWASEAKKASSPESHAAYLLLAGVLDERIGKSEDAEKADAAAVKEAPGWRTYNALAGVQARLGKLKEAEQSYIKALEFSPPQEIAPATYRQLALAQQRLMNTDGAIATWKKYLATYPDDAFAVEEAADFFISAGKFDDAKALLSPLLANPKTEPQQRLKTRLKLAEIEARRGKKAEAAKIYEAAFDDAADSSWVQKEVRERIESLYRADENLADLCKFYSERLKQHPEDVDSALSLADALVELNRIDDAAETLRKSSEQNPGKRELQLKYVNLLLRKKDSEDAEKKLSSLLTENSSDSDAVVLELLGEAQWMTAEAKKTPKDTAIVTWKKLAPEGADANVFQRLGDIFRQHGLTDDALAQYRKALEMDPLAIDRREHLVDYLVQLGKKPDALQMLSQGLGENSKPEDYRRIAAIYHRLDEQEKALEAIDKGLSIAEKKYDLLFLKWRLLSENSKWEDAQKIIPDLKAAADNENAARQVADAEIRTIQGMDRVQATMDALHQRLSANPASLSESEIALLVRLALLDDRIPLAADVIKQALQRNPNSAAFLQMDAEVAKKNSDKTRQYAALKRLSETDSKRYIDWMSELARAQRENEEYDDAIATALQVVQRFPSNTEARLLLADLYYAASKPNEGNATLKEALQTADEPVRVLLRLSDAYAMQNKPHLMRETLDQAFEKQENVNDKLQLMPKLANAYLMDGKIDDLISRFRERQRSEEGGWRYALYLAEIYSTLHDNTRAMEELDKALAGKPNDPALLRKLMGLASASGDTGAAARYAKRIFEAEPSRANREQLGNALAADGKTKEALELAMSVPDDFFANPSAWNSTISNVGNDEAGKKFFAFLDEKLKSRPEDYAAHLTFAELLISQGKTEEARRILWNIVKMDDSLASVAAASPSPSPSPAAMQANPYALLSPLQQQRNARTGNAQIAFQRVTQLFSKNSGNYYRGGFTTFGMQTQNITPFVKTKDAALIDLAALAVNDGKEAEFLAQLDEFLKTAPPEERLQVYRIVQAPSKIIAEIESILKREAVDADVLQLCISQLQELNNYASQTRQGIYGADLDKLANQLADRMATVKGNANPWFRYQWLRNASPEQRREIGLAALAKTDLNDNAQLLTAYNFVIEQKDFAKAQELLEKIRTIQQKSGTTNWAAYAQQSLAMQMLTSPQYREKGIRLFLENFAKPKATSQMLFPGRQYNSFQWPSLLANLPNTFPLSTRWLDISQVQMLRGLANNPSAKDAIPLIITALETQKEDSDSARLAGAWLLWFSGKPEDALKKLQAFESKHQDDDLLINEAALLLTLKKPKDALAVLDRLSSSSGNTAQLIPRLRFVAALQDSDKERLRAEALNLAKLQLDGYEIQELQQQMQTLGMQTDVQKLLTRHARTSPQQAGFRIAQAMQASMEAGDKENALVMARSILSSDPLASGRMNDQQYQRSQAINILRRAGELKSYREELQKKLQASPDSASLNAMMAEAAENTREALPYYQKLLEVKGDDPVWLERVAQSFMNADQPEQAQKYFAMAIRKDPETVLQRGNLYVEAFRRTNNLNDLVALITEVKPANSSRLNLNRGNASNAFMELAKQLQRQVPPINPIPLLQKALEFTPDYDQFRIRIMLARLLNEAERREAAKQVIMDAFFPSEKKDGEPLVLALNPYNGNNLWNSYSTSGNGMVEMGGLELLRIAADIGILDAIRQKYAAMPDGRNSQIDPLLFIRALQKDPSLLPDIRKMLEKENASGQANYQNNPQFLALLNVLKDWPEARPVVYDMIEKVASPGSSQNNGNPTMLLGMRLLQFDIASESKDNAKAKKAMEGWVALFDQMRSVNRGRFIGSEGLVPAFQNMADIGMAEPLLRIIADLRADKNYANDRYLMQQIAPLEADAQMATGALRSVAATVIYLPGEKEGEFVWDIAPIAGDQQEQQRGVWLRSNPLTAKVKGYTLEVYFGPSDAAMKRLFSKNDVSARGSWKGNLPADRGYLRAILRKGDEMTFGPAARVAQRQPQSPDKDPFLALANAKNGKAVGWKPLPPLQIQILPNGLVDGTKFVRLRGDRSGDTEVVMERIPIDPNKTYVAGGMVRTPQGGGYGQIQWKFYNAQGKETGNYSPRTSMRPGNWGYAMEIFSKNSQDGFQIPSRAAFVEPSLRVNGQCDVQEFYFEELPESAKK